MSIYEKIEDLEKDLLTLVEEGLDHDAYIASIRLSKLSDNFKKSTQERTVEYWNNNQHLPLGFKMKEQNRSKYPFEQDPKWNLLKSHIESREALLKQASTTEVGSIFDGDGEVVPKINATSSVVYVFSDK